MMDELNNWIEKLEKAMDDQVGLLKADPHGENNYFTRKRIIYIWEYLRKANLGVDIRDEPDEIASATGWSSVAK